jgi:hypothetical protein
VYNEDRANADFQKLLDNAPPLHLRPGTTTTTATTTDDPTATTPTTTETPNKEVRSVVNDGAAETADSSGGTNNNDDEPITTTKDPRMIALEKIIAAEQAAQTSSLDARSRYSLPLFPKEFPICRHKEPSPINIITKNAKTATFEKYLFGEHFYDMYPIRVSFPEDGTNVCKCQKNIFTKLSQLC